MSRRLNTSLEKTRYIKGSFFVVRPDTDKELFWVANALEDVSFKNTEVYVRWLNQSAGNDLEFVLASSQQSCQIPIDSILATTKLLPHDRKDDTAEMFKISKTELARIKLLAEMDREDEEEEDASDEEEEEVVEKEIPQPVEVKSKSPAKKKKAAAVTEKPAAAAEKKKKPVKAEATNGKKKKETKKKAPESDDSESDSSDSEEEEEFKPKKKKTTSKEVTKATNGKETKKKAAVEKTKKETKKKVTKKEEASDDDEEEEEEEEKPKKKKETKKKAAAKTKKSKKEEASDDEESSAASSSEDEEEEKPKKKETKKRAPAAKKEPKKTETKKRKKKEESGDEEESGSSDEKPKKKTRGKAAASGDKEKPVKEKKMTPAALKRLHLKKGMANPDIEVVDKDPTFDSLSTDIVFCCYMCTAREAIRAIQTNNMILLASIISRTDYRSLLVLRSADIKYSAFDYAYMSNNMAAVKMILEDAANDKKNRPTMPSFEKESTGSYNRYTYGHHIRAITSSRGGKEGKEAFLHDRESYNNYLNDFQNSLDNPSIALNLLTTKGVTYATVQEMVKLVNGLEDEINEKIVLAVRSGNVALAEQHIKYLVDKRGGYGFNFLHVESLGTGELTAFKSPSVTKKPIGNMNMTPMHAASINSNAKYLKAMLDVVSEPNRPDQQQFRPMHYAVTASTTATLMLLIGKGVEVNDMTISGLTPLMIACQQGHIQHIKALAKASKNGVDIVKFKNKKSLTAMHYAAESGQIGSIRTLIELGSDIDVGEKITKYTPLMKAVIAGHLEAVKVLVEEGHADIEKRDKYRRTPIMLAAKNGHLLIVSYLLHVNAVVKVFDSSHNTLLHYAAAYGWYEIAALLVNRFKVPVNDQNDYKMTPLSVSVLKGHFRITEFLMTQGGDPNVCDEHGRSILLQALDVSITSSLLVNVAYLIERHGSSVTHADKDGDTALHYLARDSSVQQRRTLEETMTSLDEKTAVYRSIGDILIKHGADINSANTKGATPLMLAFESNNVAAITFLMERGASIVGRYSDGSNVLHRILSVYDKAYFRFAEISRLVLSSPQIAEVVNQYDNAGSTPILTILEKYPSMLGTRQSFQDWKGTISQADEKKNAFADFFQLYITLAKPDLLLQEKIIESDKMEIDKPSRKVDNSDDDGSDDSDNGSDQDSDYDSDDSDNGSDYDDDDYLHPKTKKDQSKTCQKRSALHFVVLTKDTKLLSILLGAKLASLDTADVTGATPLHLAIAQNAFDCAIALVDEGANLSLVNQQKQTPLHLACHSMHFPLIKRLIGRSANVNARDKDQATALILAAKNKGKIGDEALEGEENPISLLLKNKADATLVDAQQRNALHYSINASTCDANTSFELEALLIGAGVPLNATDYLGRTPLHYCFIKMGVNNISSSTSFDPIQTVSALCSHAQVQVDVADKFGRAPLHYASQHGSTVSALHLLQRNADINRLDEDQNSPLSLALIHRHPDTAISLIQKDAKVQGTLTTFTVDIRRVPVAGSAEATAQAAAAVPTPAHPRRFKAIGHHNNNNNTAADNVVYETTVHKTNVVTVGLFYHVVLNNYQGVAYIMLDHGLDAFSSLHDAFKADKYQLALTLLAKVREPKEVGMVSPTLKQNLFHFIGLYPSSVTNWSERVQHRLLALGLSPNIRDSVGRTPLHYAACNESTQFSSFLLANKLDINAQDHEGHTALSLALLKSAKRLEISNQVALLLTSTPNVELTFPCEDKSAKVTPLILAIQSKNDKMMDLLLTAAKANINTPDASGVTPLMHAVRANSEALVDTLIAAKANVNAVDSLGRNVIHHVVNPTSYGSYENVRLLQTLAAAGAKIDVADSSKHTPSYYAALQDSGKMTATLIALGAPVMPPALRPSREQSTISTWDASINFEEDIEKYLAKRAKEDPPRPLKPVVDPSSGSVDTCEVYVDDNGLVYDILMAKVDAKKGKYGQNNFYKMQILHNRTIDTYMLFNRYGRIGSTGQFQKTAYPKDECINEFAKIFKSKSGNVFAAYNEQNPFVKMADKYNLLVIDRFDRSKKETLLPFKLEQFAPSKLSAPLQDMMRQFCDVEAIDRQIKSLRINTDIMPLGRLSKDIITQAIAILGRLKEASDLYTKREEEHDIKGMATAGEEQLSLSNAFYELIPHSNFATEKMSVLNDNRLIADKMTLLENLDELEVVSKILLAAQQNHSIHPYDYCIKAVGAQFDMLEQNSPEFAAIQAYTTNTGCSQRIVNIFRLQRKGEAERFASKSRNMDNHFLLWHGSSATNYLSILSQGLRIAPAEAPTTGYMFGKGIYFADMFKKSIGYCRGSSNSDSFLLLSEVALGKMREYYQSEYMETSQPGTNSTKGVGRQGPDFNNSIVLTNGVTIPLGHPIDNKAPESESFSLQMNEYIVYDVSQVRMRYLVQVGN
eukprot:gene3444-3911_t